MGGIFSINTSAGAVLLHCLRRNRMRTRQDLNEITISVNDVQVYTGAAHLDLRDQRVGTDDAFTATLQTHPEPGLVVALTLCGQLHITQIPTAIGHFDNLETLILSDNHIEAISWAIVYLRKLRLLNLSYNMLTEVPRVVGHLSELEELYLQGNHLSRLPVELLKLSKLIKLDVSKNYKLFSADKASIATDKAVIFSMLLKRSNRQDIWENCTPWVSEHVCTIPLTKSVLSLHELCVKHIMRYKVDFISPRFIPPVVKNNLSKVENTYRNSLNLAKCSNCKSYFSTKEYFDSHLC